MIDLDFLKQLKKLDLLAKKKVMSSYTGGQRSVKQGRGIEPVDNREYYPGDDLRFVDWKVYARTEKLFIKRFEEEKSLTTHILLDSSKSMDFKSGKYSKFDYASMLALGFAYLVTNENEKFAISTYNTQLRDVMNPDRGRKHFFDSVDLLNSQKLEGRTRLEVVAERYANYIKSRSLCIVISDFLEPVEDIRKGLFRLSKKSKSTLVVHVVDPAEKKLDWQGDIKLFDLETNQMKKIFFTPSMRRDYAVKYVAHIEKVRKICDGMGADFFSISTSDPIFDVFFQITHLARRGHANK
jgi:uncharacterized protein (DUF58 family)